ncbi:hypothetical protein [Moraxella lincolnii]|nr:hypothetical protein [Moraxella lincolnii]
MSEQDTGKVASIMAWEKSIVIVIASLTGLVIAVTAFLNAK